jgi:hypothetical protein
MTNNRSNMAFVRQVVAAALAVTMGFSGNAHAVIDFGNTIESVTINTTHPGLSGQSDFRTTATFDTHSGVFDTTTGLQWIRATTLQEGQAQGFRLATTSEFRALMLDKGWAAAGVTDQWTFTGGFSYEEATLSTAFGRSSSSSTSVENLASVSFKRDAVAFAPHITLSVTLGLLDSGGQSQVGVGLEIGPRRPTGIHMMPCWPISVILKAVCMTQAVMQPVATGPARWGDCLNRQ